MKRIILTLTLAFATLIAPAQNRQNVPAGMRMEIGSVEDNNDVCSAFFYKDDDGTVGYYLSIGYQLDLFEFIGEESSSSISHYDETCIYLGSTLEEAIGEVDAILALFDKEVGTEFELPCRKLVGVERLGDRTTVKGTVVKRFLQAKRLCFLFATRGDHSAQVDLPKPSLRSIRGMLQFEQRRQRW